MHRKLIKQNWRFNWAGAAGGALLVLLCRTGLAQTIPNPSFETDTFTTFPGYISLNAPITGWTANPADEVGLNPAGGSPFADNGAIPDGNNVAFIQAGSASDPSPGTLSTTISGLTVGTTYKVTLQANARGGQAPDLRISIDGTELMAMSIHSAGGLNPYWYIAFEFTATTTSHVLGILNDTITDNTLLVDNFQIAPSSGKWVVDAWNDDPSSGLDSSFYYTHAYKFGNATNFSINGVSFTGLGGNNPQVAGSFCHHLPDLRPGQLIANTIMGDSPRWPTNFDYGFSIPAGTAESLKLFGLTPGTTYVATIFSYGWDDAHPGRALGHVRMGNDRLTRPTKPIRSVQRHPHLLHLHGRQHGHGDD